MKMLRVYSMEKYLFSQQAQKTNAYQSNKNILLSDDASVNTKPQLEIFADDVKCSHGCTIGSLNEEGLFYLRSRGIPSKYCKVIIASCICDRYARTYQTRTHT